MCNRIKSRFAFALFMLTSFFTSPLQAVSICAAPFHEETIGFLKEHGNKLELLKFPDLLKVLQIDDPVDRFKLLDISYNRLGRDFHDATTKIADITSAQKLEALQPFVGKLQMLTLLAFQTLKKEGFQVALVQRKVRQTDFVRFSIELLEQPLVSGEAFSNILKLKKSLAIETISFDFFETVFASSRGSYNPSLDLLVLDMTRVLELIRDKSRIPSVGAHEGTHVAFERSREIGRNSIYHAEYTVSSAKSLTSNVDVYTEYMSAEEVYTFASNPFWVSTSSDLVKNLSSADYRELIFKISGYLEYAKSIFKQTKTLTRKTVEHLNEMMDGSKPFAFELKSPGGNSVNSLEKASSIQIEIDGFVYEDWLQVPDQLKKKDVILDGITGGIQGLLGIFTGRSPVSEVAAYSVSQLTNDPKTISETILFLREKQKILNKVASSLEEMTQEVHEKLDLFITQREAIEWDLKPNQAQEIEAYLQIRQSLRQLAVSAREGYKSFAGLQLYF